MITKEEIYEISKNIINKFKNVDDDHKLELLKKVENENKYLND
tara:strand:- start:262 stop:390 length:129 start_codon:yes stop_codon:yes gene_type:complete